MRILRPLLLSALACACCSVVAVADDAAQTSRRQYDQTTAKAIDFLRTKGQADDGSFSGQKGPAVTALVVTALLKHGRTPQDPVVARGLAFVETFSQKDGGVYAPGSTHRNYETALAVMCFAEANQNGKYDKQLAQAESFLKGIQWDAEESADIDNPAYGGAGYGGHKRPDLSNTSFMIDALKAAGAGPDDEAIQRALVFVSRCQNLESAANTTPFAGKNPDGGFYYTPAAGGTSQAGPTETGGLRSYGSMTYAGLKSMIFAGVKADDPRVKAAVSWLQKNYTTDMNPGMGDAGLFYYYHTFAKALDALGQETFVDSDGAKHNWRAELVAELARRQKADGSWTNENERWMEGDANLVTGYALLALDYCQP
ncbi:prenyltransferase/squalene oxidase repeat-containing protein [Lignipirellula cremea]|uniref:Squalene cyclase C-terminal domain-containing protein n=1 Tax=Lignipirellula cremea TaxID=2528010 RepID=A0A518DP96_9BACT|nr:prenyltransferase/squalene oxidase repeat-containing protein [Lignipirellula cremea]QDU93654.1 hypothetical protein Pla8534_14350 [Lignipirellula cremea]